jgi:hypothetical protein
MFYFRCFPVITKIAIPVKMSEHDEIITTATRNNSSEDSAMSPDIPSMEHTFKLLTNWNLALLIVAGVIALVIGLLSIAIDRKGGQLLTAKDAQLALDIAKVKADALIESKRVESEAAGKLAGLEEKAAKQQERASIAEAKLTGLEHDTAEAKTEMAKQQTRAAIAERSLLELRERAKIRHLSSDQRKKLIDFLATPAARAVPKGPITVNRLLMDESARPFAEELKEAFGAAGWLTGPVGQDFAGDAATPIGIVVIVHSEKSIPPHMQLMQNALIAAGFEPTLGQNLNIPEGIVEILVGVKP